MTIFEKTMFVIVFSAAMATVGAILINAGSSPPMMQTSPVEAWEDLHFEQFTE